MMRRRPKGGEETQEMDPSVILSGLCLCLQLGSKEITKLNVLRGGKSRSIYFVGSDRKRQTHWSRSLRFLLHPSRP